MHRPAHIPEAVHLGHGGVGVRLEVRGRGGGRGEDMAGRKIDLEDLGKKLVWLL